MNTKTSKNSKTNDLFMRLIRGDWSVFRKLVTTTSDDDALDLIAIGEALLSRRGEASGIMLAQRLLDTFEHSTRESQLDFFLKLAQQFAADSDVLNEAIVQYQENPCEATLSKLNKAV